MNSSSSNCLIPFIIEMKEKTMITAKTNMGKKKMRKIM
jgi:hypothetical protein